MSYRVLQSMEEAESDEEFFMRDENGDLRRRSRPLRECLEDGDEEMDDGVPEIHHGVADVPGTFALSLQN